VLTTISFLKYKKNKFWAFTQMRLAFDGLSKTPGLSFFKLLGTGSGKGFSLYPDFSTYAILCVWKNESFAKDFINKSDHSKLISKKAHSRQDFFLSPITSHGLWDGINPFIINKKEINKERKIGIITRATLNKNKLFEFWKSVPEASLAIQNANGVEWFKGIGEWPFIQQATFSIWDSVDSVKNFAYNKGIHSKIVKKTRKRKWYKEDLFARFELLNSQSKFFSI
tara:strand:+ start:5769 stop:6443 length:675 start_codon:yes stop_codon:yes gene_type:complete